MESKKQNIVTAPVPSDGTGDAGEGSRSPVLLGAEQGRCDVEAPQLEVYNGDRIWDRRAAMETIFNKMQDRIRDLEQFCGNTRNGHNVVKAQASALSQDADELSEQFRLFWYDAEENEKELNRLRKVAIGHAEISLRAMETSLQAPPASSSPVAVPVVTAVNKGRKKARPKKIKDPPPVNKKRDGNDAVATRLIEDKTKDGKKRTRMKPTPGQAYGVVISRKAEGISYADVMLQEDSDTQGVSITASRQTAARDLLLTVGKGAGAAAEAVKLKKTV